MSTQITWSFNPTKQPHFRGGNELLTCSCYQKKKGCTVWFCLQTERWQETEQKLHLFLFFFWCAEADDTSCPERAATEIESKKCDIKASQIHPWIISSVKPSHLWNNGSHPFATAPFFSWSVHFSRQFLKNKNKKALGQNMWIRHW